MAAKQEDKRPDLLIVGGGVAGCTLAFELSRSCRVRLLERGRVGEGGASSVPVALLNPYRGRSARASELDLAGLRAVWGLVSELEGLGLDHGVRWSGIIRIASSAKQAKIWQKREGVQWLETVPEPYHAPFGGFLFPGGGWLEPRRFLHALLMGAEARGAEPLEGCRVEGLHPEKGGWVLETSHGEMRSRTVVLCVGADPNPALPLPPLERFAGDVIGLKVADELPYPFAGAVYGAQVENHLYLGGNHRPADETDPTAPGQLQRAGGWFLPMSRDAPHLSTWTGVRAKTEDNTPLLEELAPGLWFFGALAGRGFLCSAFFSRRLAARLEQAHGAAYNIPR